MYVCVCVCVTFCVDIYWQIAKIMEKSPIQIRTFSVECSTVLICTDGLGLNIHLYIL